MLQIPQIECTVRDRATGWSGTAGHTEALAPWFIAVTNSLGEGRFWGQTDGLIKSTVWQPASCWSSSHSLLCSPRHWQISSWKYLQNVGSSFNNCHMACFKKNPKTPMECQCLLQANITLMLSTVSGARRWIYRRGTR